MSIPRYSELSVKPWELSEEARFFSILAFKEGAVFAGLWLKGRRRKGDIRPGLGSRIKPFDTKLWGEKWKTEYIIG